MTMYDRIKKLRLEQDLSQEDLAHKVGYKGRSMIARIESGQVDISQSKVKAFAIALNTSVDYLMDDARPIHPEVIKMIDERISELENSDEKELLSLYRGMIKTDKEKLLDFARFIAESYKRQDKRRK